MITLCEMQLKTMRKENEVKFIDKISEETVPKWKLLDPFYVADWSMERLLARKEEIHSQLKEDFREVGHNIVKCDCDPIKRNETLTIYLIDIECELMKRKISYGKD